MTYLTLAYDRKYPNNSLGNFQCLLTEPLIFKENYQVALKDFYFFPNYVNTKQWITYINIHCDIIEPYIVNNRYQNILYTVKAPLKKSESDILNKEIERPRYFKVNKTFINRVEIQLTDQYFRPVILTSEPINLNLHFKKLK